MACSLMSTVAMRNCCDLILAQADRFACILPAVNPIALALVSPTFSCAGPGRGSIIDRIQPGVQGWFFNWKEI